MSHLSLDFQREVIDRILGLDGDTKGTGDSDQVIFALVCGNGTVERLQYNISVDSCSPCLGLCLLLCSFLLLFRLFRLFLLQLGLEGVFHVCMSDVACFELLCRSSSFLASRLLVSCKFQVVFGH